MALTTVKIPSKSLLSPSRTAAVCGGNVLTSQRIVDVVLKAFHAAAASQGCTKQVLYNILSKYQSNKWQIVTSPLELAGKIKMGKVSQVGDIMRYFGIGL